MKPLNISIVDDDPEVTEVLKLGLTQRPGALKDLEIQYSKHNPTTSQKILNKNPDLVILDCMMDPSGPVIANQLKSQKPYLPILLMSGLPLAQRHKLMANAQNTNIADGVFGKPFNFPEVSTLIRRKIKRPLDIGIIGLGNLGLGFLEVSATNPNLGKINAYSENMRDLYEDMQNIETIGNNPNISFKNRLEDALENTECVLICTSAKHGTSAEKLAENPNRSDLLSLEYEKINQYAERIKQTGYQGLVVFLTNPVGESLELAKRTGLDPTQVTSPFLLDEQRIRGSIKRQNPELYEKIKRKIRVVGQHGVPIADISPNISDEAKEIIMAAESHAQTIPKDSMLAHDTLGRTYLGPQKTYSKFLDNLAELKGEFHNSAYAHVDINSQNGHVAVPYQVSFFPHIRITPNQKGLNKISGEVKEELAQRIKAQNENVNQLQGALV